MFELRILDLGKVREPKIHTNDRFVALLTFSFLPSGDLHAECREQLVVSAKRNAALLRVFGVQSTISTNDADFPAGAIAMRGAQTSRFARVGWNCPTFSGNDHL